VPLLFADRAFWLLYTHSIHILHCYDTVFLQHGVVNYCKQNEERRHHIYWLLCNRLLFWATIYAKMQFIASNR